MRQAYVARASACCNNEIATSDGQGVLFQRMRACNRCTEAGTNRSEGRNKSSGGSNHVARITYARGVGSRCGSRCGQTLAMAAIGGQHWRDCDALW